MSSTTMASSPSSVPAVSKPAGNLFFSVAPWIVLLILAAFPLVAPMFGIEYYVGFVRRVMIVMFAAMSLNFLIGYGGLVAMGHASFVGVGAYFVVAMSDAGAGSTWMNSAWVMWLVALLGTGLVAAAIGSVALRTKGVYFIMITLAFAQMLYYVAVGVRRYGGDDGYTMMTKPVIGFTLKTPDFTLYWMVLLLGAIIFALYTRIGKSRFGRAMEGIRDNETRMQALGYPVYLLKLCAFAGAGAIAGLSGALIATQNGFVSPSMMHWTQSATLIVMVVVGGIGKRWGAIIGVAIWMVLEEVIKQFTDYWHWPLGLMLIIVVFYAPHGVASLHALRRAVK